MKNIPMKVLLVVTLIILFFITGAIQSLYIFNISLTETTELVNTLYENQNDYQMQNINQYLNKIESIATTIKTSNILYKNIVNTDTLDFNEKYTINKEMNQFLTELAFSNEEIAGILILHDYLSVYKSPISFGYYNLSDISNTYLLEQINTSNISGYTETFNNDILSNSNFKNIFVYYEKILKNGKQVATICIIIDSNHIEEVIGENDPENILILKTNNAIIYPIQPEDTIIDLETNNNTEDIIQQVNIKGKQYLYTDSTSKNGLSLINLIPMNRLTEASSYISRALIISFGIACILFLVLILFFSNTLTKNIRLLITKMMFVGTKKYQSTNSNFLLAEVNSLNDNFNTMNTRILDLVATIHQEEIAINKTKIDLLKAQINPHFIYNTLDTINWMAINNDSTDISEMVSDLGNMFRYSLNNGRNYTTIKQELEHLRLYLNIQRYRHTNRFVIEEDIDPSLLDCYILNVILQPIVENCLVHGFRNNNSILTIRIILKKVNATTLQFIISDDGIGCNESLLNDYIHSDKYTTQGYGVKNINDRIKLYFGEHGSVQYNEIEIGTEVAVTIPLLTTVTEEMEN